MTLGYEILLTMYNIEQSGVVGTSESWRKWCDASYWNNERPSASMDFTTGDVVFCKIDEVLRFFEILRLTRRRIILVTGEGDFPCDNFRQSFMPVNVDHWFATNVTHPHPRVTALPLGLGSPNSSTTLKAEEIISARDLGRASGKWLYVNFRPTTNPSERQAPFDHFHKISSLSDWITFDHPFDRGNNEAFLAMLVTHRFVLCPPGNGVDTHRMWEALLAGAIPVVKRSTAMKPFYSLPILFVDDFSEVTQDLLAKAYEEIMVPAQIPDIMTEKYWAGVIRGKQSEPCGNNLIGWGEWIAESANYGAGMLARRLGIIRGAS
jgi:hypothetical protein